MANGRQRFGFLTVAFEGQKTGSPQSVFNWTRDLEYTSDGVDSWWSAKEPVFTYGGPMTEQLEKEPIVVIAQKSVQRMIERNR